VFSSSAYGACVSERRLRRVFGDRNGRVRVTEAPPDPPGDPAQDLVEVVDIESDPGSVPSNPDMGAEVEVRAPQEAGGEVALSGESKAEEARRAAKRRMRAFQAAQKLSSLQRDEEQQAASISLSQKEPVPKQQLSARGASVVTTRSAG
jgi:hypothetical protein